MADPTLPRRIPQADQLLQNASFSALLDRFSRIRVVAGLREQLAEVRRQAVAGNLDPEELTPAALALEVERRLGREIRPYYRRVINATGVVLHTGLGRASLPQVAAEAVRELAVRPQRLEIDLETGERGGRDAGCAQLLTRILGCEEATVVNNNAAATLVALAALAEGRKVVLSRGELVEIGGSYRIPEIIAQSGAVMTEVGTTNRTHLEDYARALDGEAGALVKVHTSNYEVKGFTSEVGIEELVALGREHSIPVIHDLGSGCLLDLGESGLPPEQQAQHSLAAGVDLVCFSGDKLLGGPQAGVLAGTSKAVDRCRRHPLFRAMRPGRMVYTALEATLQLYLDGPQAAIAGVPALAQLAEAVEVVEARARELAADLADVNGLEVEVVATTARPGSGALPLVEVPSFGVRLRRAACSADELAAQLRVGDPSILGRVRDDAVVLDLRTVPADDLGDLLERLTALD